MTDEELVGRLAAGPDEAALSELYDRYQGAMYGLAMRITNDVGLAQDAVQEAFVGVWRNAARYAEGRASVRTWMLSICHHRAIDMLRRRRATSPLPEIAERAAVPLGTVKSRVRLGLGALRRALEEPEPA